MESSETSPDRLALISQYRERAAARVHSPLRGYVALGVLWASPLAALALSRPWALFAALIVIASTALWMVAFTRRRGVRLAPFAPASRESKLAAWMVAYADTLSRLFGTPAATPDASPAGT